MGSTTAQTLDPAEPGFSSRLYRVLPALSMLVAVGVAAALPLLRNTIFYFWDDSAAAAAPLWRIAAESVLHGEFPTMRPDLWRGGNLSAEAATGVWNPIVLLVVLGTYAIDNMALAMTIGKTFFLGVLALGSYLLARNYRVQPWLAAAVGLAVPLAGYQFFINATSWVNALMTTAFVPWLWLAARRALYRDRGGWVWVIIASYLVCSIGNPYGLLGTGMVFLGILVEACVTRRRGRIVGLILSGISALLLMVAVYLPLLLTSHVGFRAASQTYNDEFFSPNLTDIAGLSTPTFQPWLTTFGGPNLPWPGMYLSWFVLPLLPWLKLRTIIPKLRSLTTVWVFGGISLLLVLGPSQVWMFRWPLRMIDFLWFPVLLLWAVLANEGLARNRITARSLTTLGIIFFGGWLAWSDLPGNLNRIVAGCLGVAVLTALAVRLGVRSKAGSLLMLAGTVLVLGGQLVFYPAANGVANYQFPTKQSLIKERFAKYEGMTVQIANLDNAAPGDMRPDRVYKDMLFGTMYGAAGVESTSDYSGIGFSKMDSALCMVYQGSVCKDAWATLWRKPPGYDVPFADLLRARTVVVQNALIDTRNFPPPVGWRQAPEAATTELVTVWKRIDPLPWPNGRVADITGGVRVTADDKAGTTDERIAFTAGQPGSVTFARLAWPGYTATVDGRSLPTRTGPNGLLVVDIPAGVASGEIALNWRVPGHGVSLASSTAGALMAVGLGVGPMIIARRRKRRQETSVFDAADAATGSNDDAHEPLGKPVGSASREGLR